MIAEFRAAFTPPRTAREPPVRKPAPMAFQGSSVFRMPLMAQSYFEVLAMRILLGSFEGIDSTYCTEKTTPNTEVSAQNRGASLDGCEGTYPALAVGTVAETFDTVPDRTSDSLKEVSSYSLFRDSRMDRTYAHAESTTEVAQGNIWARIPGVVHCVRVVRRSCKNDSRRGLIESAWIREWALFSKDRDEGDANARTEGPTTKAIREDDFLI
jgi:hypothetical protein